VNACVHLSCFCSSPAVITSIHAVLSPGMRTQLSGSCGRVQLGRGLPILSIEAPCLPAPTQPDSVPVQCIAHLMSPFRSLVEPTPPQALSNVSNAAARRNEQLRLLPIQMPSPQFGRRGELGKQTHRAFATLKPPRVGAVQEPIPSLSSSIASVQECNRGLRCQLSCAKYLINPPIPCHAHPISRRQPNGQASCTRITVATLWPQDLGRPPSPDAIGLEYGGHPDPLPRATIICCCN
jgi:hypothetical protein